MHLHCKASEIDHSEDNGLGMFHQGTNMDHALWGLKASANNDK